MDVHRRLQPLDDFQQRHAWLAFPIAVWKKFSDDRAGNLAALIAYYGFLSLFPLLLVLVTVLGIVLNGHPSLQHKVLHSALAEFPVIGQQLKSNVHSLDRTGFGLTVGLLGTFLGARGVANAAQNAFNSVWDVPIKDRPGFPHNQLRSVGLIVFVGLGMIVTTALSTFGGGTGSAGAATRVGAIAVAFMLNIFLFWLAFRIATAPSIHARDMLLGALVAAIFWQILQAVGGYLISHQLRTATPVYGMFGTVLALLAWIYLQAQMTLYAVEICVVRTRALWPRSLFPPPLTEADERAYDAYAKVEERRQPQEADLDVNEPVRSSRR